MHTGNEADTESGYYLQLFAKMDIVAIPSVAYGFKRATKLLIKKLFSLSLNIAFSKCKCKFQMGSDELASQ